jgi:hypothetical protein
VGGVTAWAKIPEALLEDRRVGDRAQRVYGVLRRYGTTPEDCHPSHATIAARLGGPKPASKRSVNGWVAELEAAGWIRRAPRRTAAGDWDSNGYHVYDEPQGVRAEQRVPTRQPARTYAPGTAGGTRQPARGVRAEERAKREPVEREPKNENPPYPPAASKSVVALHGGRGGMPATFDDFWLAYPRKQSRGPARHAWVQATRRAAPDEIVAGARRYAADPNRVDRYTVAPARWLEEERWADGPLPDRNPNESLARLNRMAEAIDAGADPFAWTPEQPSISSASSPPTGGPSFLPSPRSSGS